MMYGDVVADFAYRTEMNLQHIEKEAAAAKNRVFEVTQLVNSMLGLLVFPQQEFVDHIPRTPLSELEAAGWPSITANWPEGAEGNLKDLVRFLRNAIAHFNLEFEFEKDRSITGIKVWNERHNKRTWEAQLSLGDLKIITKKFVELLTDTKIINKV